MKKFLLGAIGVFFWGGLALPVVAFGQNIQIFNGADVNFGTWYPSTGNIANTQQVCVFKTGTLNQTWRLTATGEGSGGAFELKGLGGTIPISSVQLNNFVLNPGVRLSNNPNADVIAPADCAEFGGDNQNIKISINASALGSISPGVYTGQLTFVAEP